jgi:hypothetical protein
MGVAARVVSGSILGQLRSATVDFLGIFDKFPAKGFGRFSLVFRVISVHAHFIKLPGGQMEGSRAQGRGNSRTTGPTHSVSAQNPRKMVSPRAGRGMASY